MHCLNKKISKALRQEIVEWVMKKSNVRVYTIAHDNLIIIIIDAESGVKRKVPKILLECSMRQLHNDLATSPDDGGLLGSRQTNTNDVKISDTMLCSLVPLRLRPMTDHQKMMCGCAICNTSKYFRESLNAWQQKQLKIIKNKAYNSH